jgi:hypothetical protein
MKNSSAKFAAIYKMIRAQRATQFWFKEELENSSVIDEVRVELFPSHVGSLVMQKKAKSANFHPHA